MTSSIRLSDRALAALDYGGRGWPVLPLHDWLGHCSCADANCPSPGKHPRTAHGVKDATADPAKIQSWWRVWPNANVGLATGHAFDVCDVDGNVGDSALASAAKMAGATAADCVTHGPMTSTGKGWHLFFAPTGHGNRAGIVDQVDWRGVGGYVVAPPSIHSTGRTYEWLPNLGPDTPCEAVPWWLLNLVSRRTQSACGWIPSMADAPAGRYGVQALNGELGQLAVAPIGSRNDALFNSARALGQLVAGGALPAAYVVSSLLTVAERIGLTSSEASATITSGLRSGLAQPRRHK